MTLQAAAGGSARNTPPAVVARVHARQLIERSPPPAARSRLRGTRMEGGALLEGGGGSSKALRKKPAEGPPSKGRCALLSEAEALIGNSPLATTNDPTPRCAAAGCSCTHAASSDALSGSLCLAHRRALFDEVDENLMDSILNAES